MPLYMVISNLTGPREKLADHRQAHYDFIENLRRDGNLILAGRFGDGSGGVYVIKAESLEAADQVAQADPYHVNKLRSYLLKEWQPRYPASG